jgi:hypothetical protein
VPFEGVSWNGKFGHPGRFVLMQLANCLRSIRPMRPKGPVESQTSRRFLRHVDTSPLLLAVDIVCLWSEAGLITA